MSDASTLGLPCAEFHFERAWPVKPADFQTEQNFSTWLETEALKAIQRHRERMAPRDYEAALAGWTRDVASGRYAWEGEVSRDARAVIGSPGWKHFAYLRLKQADPEATRELIDRACQNFAKAKELDEALWRADDPLARGRSGSASPS